MSKKQAIAFFEEISKNKQLAQEVKKVVEGNNSDEAKAKELLSLAKNHNFIFTKEEAASAQEALKKPLSPEEMLEVSGGKLNLKSSIMAMTLLAGLGVGGVTMSSMEASAMKRSAPSGFNSSRKIGKRGKIDKQPQTTPDVQQQSVGRQQTTPQPVEPTNPMQNGTTPSGGQGTAQSTEQHAPRQLNEFEKHDKEAAKRFEAAKLCRSDHVNWARRVSASGALPAENWPAAPPANLDAKKEICRFCGDTLSARGKKALDVKCANAGCIYNWVFSQTGNKQLKGNQRGQKDFGHYARWALLPVPILDSRHKYINSTGNTGRGAARNLAIETPAEAWAVWQLIVGHNNDWVDVTTMLRAYGVDATTIERVKELLEESYDNLVQGNESFIDLGSAVQQLVEGHNNDWQQVRTTMALRGYDAEGAIELLENSYNMLTDEQLQQTGYDPTKITRNPEVALAEIEAAHQRFEFAMQQAEEARETARRQTIEMLQRVEQLSDEQKKNIASRVAQSGLITCRCKKVHGGNGCGSNKIRFHQLQRGSFYFVCNACKASNGEEKGSFFTLTPAELLAMLKEGAQENAPAEMADAEQNEQQRGTQDISQFNPGQQMTMLRNTTHNDYGMDFDDDEDYVDRDFYDKDGNLRKLKEQRPPEEKERREDYENMQMMEEDSPVENQTRHNVVPSAFRPSTEDFQIIEGTEFNQELQGSSQRHLQLMMPLQAERRFEMQHKDYENQETNPNIPQLPHLQPHRSMILENTNETITPLTTENLDDIGDALINEISNEAPDFARIQSMLQSAKEARANILQLRSFDDVLIMVKDAANYHRRDDIIKLIDSWFF